MPPPGGKIQTSIRTCLYTTSLVSLTDVLIGWRASDCDAPTQLLRIQINTGNTAPSPTWWASPTWRKQKAFPLPDTVALWVFWKSREFPAFFRGRGQSYARRHGTWNSLELAPTRSRTGRKRRAAGHKRQHVINRRPLVPNVGMQPCVNGHTWSVAHGWCPDVWLRESSDSNSVADATQAGAPYIPTTAARSRTCSRPNPYRPLEIVMLLIKIK